MSQSAKGRPRRLLHALAAAGLRQEPGTWKVLGEWRSVPGAQLTAGRIRNGFQVYGPKGAYQARVEPTEHGARVMARYVGIATGEVPAGRESARRIAAQHEAAYGAKVWGTASNDDAWAEALAALSEDGAE